MATALQSVRERGRARSQLKVTVFRLAFTAFESVEIKARGSDGVLIIQGLNFINRSYRASHVEGSAKSRGGDEQATENDGRLREILAIASGGQSVNMAHEILGL